MDDIIPIMCCGVAAASGSFGEFGDFSDFQCSADVAYRASV